MKGLAEVLEAWESARARGEAAVLATVVRVEGSAYRRPGARMLFPARGGPTGFLSGGCLEGDLAERAGAVLASGESRTIVYDMRSPDDIVWGLGLGCNGEVRVLLERLDPGRSPDYLAFVSRCLDERESGVVATLFDVPPGAGIELGARMTASRAGCAGSIGPDELRRAVEHDLRAALAAGKSRAGRYEIEQGLVEAFIELLVPPVSLLVFGAGSDAQPLVRLAKALGWRVTVLDHREAYARAERFPEADSIRLVRFDGLDPHGLGVDRRTACLVMTHHFLHDLELVKTLLPLAPPYLGLLGPRQRTRNLLDELARGGFEIAPERLEALHGPVGLDIGSETPEEIAISALAEIQAVLAGREGGFLRRRRGPLHDWPQ